MNILDYSFARLYFWYKRRREKFDHKKLTSAAQNAMAILGGFVAMEFTFATTGLCEIDDDNSFTAILIAYAVPPIFGAIYYYSDNRANVFAKEYEELDNDKHKEIRRKTWLIFWIIQLICSILIFYRSVILRYISEYS